MVDVRVNEQSFGGVQYHRLSDQQLQRIHFASLEVLERTGVVLHHQRAIDRFNKAGAWVSDGNRVRIPNGLVEKALTLTTVPKRVVLCDRYGNRTVHLEGTCSYFGPGSDLLNIIDRHTNQRHKPVLSEARGAPAKSRCSWPRSVCRTPTSLSLTLLWWNQCAGHPGWPATTPACWST